MKTTLPIAAVTLALVAPLITLADEAVELAHQLTIIDTHIDAPYRIYRGGGDLLQRNPEGEFDVPRAKEGGLDVIFMSIYTSANSAEEGKSKAIAETLIDLVESTASKGQEQVGIATCTRDYQVLVKQGKLAFAYGLENASPFEGSIAALRHFYDRGIRYVTLAHSKSNEFSDSSYDENEPWQGLSPTGKELVTAMNALGVMIDLSHLSDNAAWQVLRLTHTPVIASHSSLRHFIPGFHRNMTDEMVKAMQTNGGVVQINFGSTFISQEARAWSDQRTERYEEFQGDRELTIDERRAFFEDYQEEHPFPFASVNTVADHIDRVVEIAGIDYVGLGSDFDGVGDTLPIGLKDVAEFPNLIRELLERGYSRDDLAKILGGNLERVWKANEAYATAQGNPPVCRQD